MRSTTEVQYTLKKFTNNIHEDTTVSTINQNQLGFYLTAKSNNKKKKTKKIHTHTQNDNKLVITQKMSKK